VFRRFPTPPAPTLAVLCAAAVAGFLGLLPGRAGARDPVTLLGWLTLVAPALGTWCGSTRVTFFPFALAVPSAWGLALVLAQAGTPRPLAGAHWALCALAGLFALGFAWGRRARAPLGGAGTVLLVTLALAAAPVGGGLVAGGAELARAGHPRTAATLVELSPLVWVFDCAGWDWTHAQGDVYRRAGVEWFQRRSFAGSLAGPGVLVVGCLLALLVRARNEP